MATIQDKIVNYDENSNYLLSLPEINSIEAFAYVQLKLQRLFKAKNDSFTALAFHQKCDNSGPNIVVAQLSTGKKVGGYTKLSWKTGVSEYDFVADVADETFLFSLTDNKKWKLKLNAWGYKYAICNSIESGPKYGGGHDWDLCNNCDVNFNKWGNFGFSFNASNSDGVMFYGNEEKKFNVVDYEVYKIV